MAAAAVALAAAAGAAGSAVAAREEARPVVEVAASADAARRRIEVLGIAVDDVSREDAVGLIQRHMQSGIDRLMHVVTLNPEYVMAARADPAFRDAISRAELVICDGVGVLVATRSAASARKMERITGVELTGLLAELSGYHDGGLFLLGGRDADAAAAVMKQRYPQSRIAGYWSDGGPESVWDDETHDRIRESRASILLVGYGAPAQVLWIDRNRDRLRDSGVRIAVGVGGALDYLSGHARQAPVTVQRAGFEWLYRLMREPWRWRRQAVLPRFALLAGREALEARRPYRILALMNRRTNDQDGRH